MTSWNAVRGSGRYPHDLRMRDDGTVSRTTDSSAPRARATSSDHPNACSGWRPRRARGATARTPRSRRSAASARTRRLPSRDEAAIPRSDADDRHARTDEVTEFALQIETRARRDREPRVGSPGMLGVQRRRRVAVGLATHVERRILVPVEGHAAGQDVLVICLREATSPKISLRRSRSRSPPYQRVRHSRVIEARTVRSVFVSS